jgi:hypothetical protein
MKEPKRAEKELSCHSNFFTRVLNFVYLNNTAVLSVRLCSLTISARLTRSITVGFPTFEFRTSDFGFEESLRSQYKMRLLKSAQKYAEMSKNMIKKPNLKPIKPEMSLLKAILKPINTQIKCFKPALFGFAYNNEPIKANCGKLDAVTKTNPIFLRPIMDFYAKNAEMEAEKQPKKTKQTQLWKTFRAAM